MNSILKNNLFRYGLLIKIFSVIFFLPIIQENLFNSFITFFINNPSFDAWTNYLNNSNNIIAFPYGPVMLTVFLPLTYLGKLIGLAFGHEIYFIGLGFRITLLFFDFFGLILFKKLFPSKLKKILIFYWLSPLIFYVTFIHGQIDLVPSVFLLGAYSFISVNQFKKSGLFLGLALASKLSIAIILPIPIIYIFQNNRLVKGLSPFIKSLFLTSFSLVILPLLSIGYRKMVFGSPMLNSVFWFKFSMGNQFEIFLLPIALLLIYYFLWRIKRSNFILLTSVSGFAFLVSVLMMPPNPGWLIWSLPFLIMYQMNSDITGKILVTSFSLLSIIFISLNFSVSKIYFLFKDFEVPFNYLQKQNQGLLYTIFISIGIILCIRLYRESIRNNDYFRLSRNPISIGICGGPKSGKKELSDALIDIFGEHSSIQVFQKDYLKWINNSPMWKRVSVYNSRSQDLLKLSRDLNLLISKNNQKELLKKDYSRLRSKNNPFIIVNGFHLFQSKTFSDLFAIKIFLEPSSTVNNFWLHKNEKNESISNKNIATEIEKYQKLYLDQKNLSDLVFKLSYVNEENASFKNLDNKAMKLDIYLADGIYVEKLVKALISICGVKANLNIDERNFNANLSIEGDIWSEDIKLAAEKLIPDLKELIDAEPKWRSDCIGIMQLIIMMQISHYFKRRD